MCLLLYASKNLKLQRPELFPLTYVPSIDSQASSVFFYFIFFSLRSLAAAATSESLNTHENGRPIGEQVTLQKNVKIRLILMTKATDPSAAPWIKKALQISGAWSPFSGQVDKGLRAGRKATDKEAS